MKTNYCKCSCCSTDWKFGEPGGKQSSPLGCGPKLKKGLIMERNELLAQYSKLTRDELAILHRGCRRVKAAGADRHLTLEEIEMRLAVVHEINPDL